MAKFMQEKKHSAFTIRYPSFVKELYTVSKVFDYYHHLNFFETKKSLWDTGATTTGINIDLAHKLKLMPFRKISVQGAHGKKTVDIYLIDLEVPNNIMFKNIRATGLELGADVDVLVGMDIIMSGDFAISNSNGKTTFSYSTPPLGNEVDFEKKAQETNRSIQT